MRIIKITKDVITVESILSLVHKETNLDLSAFQ
jgi:hypothetical protein